MPEEGFVLQSVAAAARWQFGYKSKSWLLSEHVLFIITLNGLICDIMGQWASAPFTSSSVLIVQLPI